ncbi:thiol-activated cytolysin family protein [Bacillus sp. DX1.1]|uniref:thiol-activated cytolysin family protein n=1 Tax=Bacillus sp. DX1.1 TaxID=3055866 RepID=UPI00338FB184
MVSNVTYGRTVYVKLETSSKSKDVQAAFKALIEVKALKRVDSTKIFLKTVPFYRCSIRRRCKHNKVVTKDFNEIEISLKIMQN